MDTIRLVHAPCRVAEGMHETGMNVVMEGGRETDRIIQPTW